MASLRQVSRLLLLLLVVVFATSQRAAASVTVELNDALARSYADPSARSLSFAGTTKPLPAGILMTVDGYYGGQSDAINCSITETKRERQGKNVTVLLLLSKCLNDVTLSKIESWIADMKAKEYTFLQDGIASPIEFAVTVVPGSCQERNAKQAKSAYQSSPGSVTLESSPTANLFLSENVLQGDLDRVAAFARFGRVLDAPPSPESGKESERAIAVISFVNNARSFDEVELFERTFKVSKAFNFIICKNGKDTCGDSYENAILVSESVDLVFYSPFTVTHTFACPALENGIPVSYIDAKQGRQCFCTCPAGFELQSGAGGVKFCAKAECDSEASCAWNTHPYGFKHEVTTALGTCSLSKIASAWGVPVPFPSDNYVADGRANANSGTSIGPHVKLSTSKLPSQAYDGARLLSLSSLGDVGLFERRVAPPSIIDLLDLLAMGDLTEYISVPEPIVALSADELKANERLYSWAYYQSHRREVIDELTFSAYGKYSLTLYAKDYKQNATCTGCLAIVDKFRPTATTTCPSSLPENDADGGAELTTASLPKVDALVLAFFQFAENAMNDACSTTRCDENVWKMRDFFETAFSDYRPASAEQVKKTFKTASVKTALLTALKAQKNPIAKASDQSCAKPDTMPVASGQCKRCVKLSSALREYWTDYTCQYEYDVQKCEGDAKQKCSLDQCLVVNGNSLATVTATLTSAAAKESKALGATTATEIRKPVGSQCSKIGGASAACKVQIKLSQIVDGTASANAKSVLGTDSTSYVFWRYRVTNTGEWKLWKGSTSEDTETFKDAATKVYVEAWTACGMIASQFTFSVVLVLPKPSYYGSMLSAVASSLVSASEGNVAGEAVATSLAACSLVALVVVVVKRRRSSADAAERVHMDEAYLPLLE